MPVGVAQRIGRLARDPQRVLHRELPLPPEPVAQGFAFDEGHGEPEQRRTARPGEVPRVVHREDVRVLQAGGEADLALEAFRAEGGGELGMEHLECDGAVMAEVAREPDRGHAPAAELALERVPFPQPFAQCRYGVRHAVPSTSLRNRGCLRSGSNVGSIRSHPGER